MKKTIRNSREEVLKAAAFIEANRKTAYLWSNGSSNFYDVNGVIWEYWHEGLGEHPTSDGDLVFGN